jgi:hypothetical protein
MKKIKMMRHLVIEYIPNPEYYPEGSTIEQMAEIDANQDDLETTFMDAESSVTYEIIDED